VADPSSWPISCSPSTALHLPLNRQSAVDQREGIDLDVSTLADWVGGGEHPEQHLAGHAGLMQADAYAGYVAPKIMLRRRMKDPGTAAIVVSAAHN
jgi:hypothetical protein